MIRVDQADLTTASQVIDLVVALIEELDQIILDPSARSRMEQDTAELIGAGERLWALLAYVGDDPVGVLTLNECAAIYAGGFFGEICETYVRPSYRSRGAARTLIDHATGFGATRGGDPVRGWRPAPARLGPLDCILQRLRIHRGRPTAQAVLKVEGI